ncbi:MAG: hypothetical protein OXC14_13645 [Rhodospirillaceae bacterium]|nr:hypothetical protein [Rhodospirillaceae bacterium]
MRVSKRVKDFGPEVTLGPGEVTSAVRQSPQTQTIYEPRLACAGKLEAGKPNTDWLFSIGAPFVKTVLYGLAHENIRRLQIRAAKRVGHVAGGENPGPVFQEAP